MVAAPALSAVLFAVLWQVQGRGSGSRRRRPRGAGEKEGQPQQRAANNNTARARTAVPNEKPRPRHRTHISHSIQHHSAQHMLLLCLCHSHSRAAKQRATGGRCGEEVSCPRRRGCLAARVTQLYATNAAMLPRANTYRSAQRAAKHNTLQYDSNTATPPTPTHRYPDAQHSGLQ